MIALLEANQEDDAARTQAAGELGRVQRGLNERIDELESRIDDLASSEDVSNLDDRLGEARGRVDQIQSGNERLSGRVDDLETRVEELEQSSESSRRDHPLIGQLADSPVCFNSRTRERRWSDLTDRFLGTLEVSGR